MDPPNCYLCFVFSWIFTFRRQSPTATFPQLDIEKKNLTLHYTGCLIGILIMDVS